MGYGSGVWLGVSAYGMVKCRMIGARNATGDVRG